MFVDVKKKSACPTYFLTCLPGSGKKMHPFHHQGLAGWETRTTSDAMWVAAKKKSPDRRRMIFFYQETKSCLI